MVEEQQEKLMKYLKENDISDEKIQDVLDSGYFTWNSLNPFSGHSIECIMDSFYGNKQFSGFLDKEHFVNYLKNDTYPVVPITTQVVTVQNVEEIYDIVNSEKIQYYIKNGKMSFRGQVADYKTKRKIPNPVRRLDDGNERIILPSFWRDYYDKPLSNRSLGQPNSILTSYEAIDIFRDDLTKEIDHEKLKEAIIYGSYSPEPYHLEQHYGFKTTGLDVTFDIDVAIFFATNKFYSKPNGKADFREIQVGEHKGVIYLFVFRDPSLPKTEFLIEKFKYFSHLNPIRPIRQNCALPGFNFNNINAAVCDLDTIIILDKNAQIKNKYAKEYLFPNSTQDLFYSKMLALKTKYPNKWKDIAEYDF